VKPIPAPPPPETRERVDRPVEVAASAPADVGTLLPPSTAKGDMAAAVDTAPKRVSSVDELLPPGVSPSAASTTFTPDDGSSQNKGPEGTVVLPSPDGGFVTVKESVKTVEYGREEVELRKLTPEQKARRRLIRTLILVTFGLLFLSAVAIVLIMVNG
jgi:hypothetical protein